MPVHEKEKVVKLNDRVWKIGKFDALTGGYIALKMSSRLSSLAVGIFAGQVKDPAVIAMSVATEIGAISKAEFLEVQSECLHVVKEIETVGDKQVDSPARLPDGRWGVKGLEDDALTVMALVAHVLVFNLTSFFDANALKTVKESFPDFKSFSA